MIGTTKRKRCGMCGHIKSLKEFHVRRASPDKRCHTCKSCQQAYDKTGSRYALHPISTPQERTCNG